MKRIPCDSCKNSHGIELNMVYDGPVTIHVDCILKGDMEIELNEAEFICCEDYNPYQCIIVDESFIKEAEMML